MLLKFFLEKNSYFFDSNQVVEVVPLLKLEEIPGAPEEVAGSFIYRGVAVPVIDLGRAVTGTNCSPHLSTRIVVTRYPTDRLTGFIVEDLNAASEEDNGSKPIELDELLSKTLKDLIPVLHSILRV